LWFAEDPFCPLAAVANENPSLMVSTGLTSIVWLREMNGEVAVVLLAA